jgi:hypothetical protein
MPEQSGYDGFVGDLASVTGLGSAPVARRYFLIATLHVDLIAYQGARRSIGQAGNRGKQIQ